MARTYNHLYPQIYGFGNLHEAYLKARKGRRYQDEVLAFSSHLEENLINLQNHLIYKTYRLSPYRFFHVYEPKERLVAALPFADRVIQHALCNVMAPIFEKTFIYDSYACRIKKGVLAGVNRTTKFLREAERKWGKSKVYCFKGDIAKYFPNINHAILKDLIRRKITCQDTLWLIDQIIDSLDEIGLPIGNLTSQIWANVYLNELDHFVKDNLQIKYYIRYMDDWVIFHNNKRYLHQCRQKVEAFLALRLALKTNSKTQIFPVRSRGVDFLGYRIFPDYRLLRKGNLKRSKRRLRKMLSLYQKGLIAPNEFLPVIMSWWGHCKHADTYRVRSRMLRSLVEGIVAQRDEKAQKIF